VGDEEVGEAKIGELLLLVGGVGTKINIFGFGIRTVSGHCPQGNETRRDRTGRHSRSRLGPYSDNLGLGGRRTDAGELSFLDRVP